ncbi:MAG: helix-turn-helix transcriptional regulator [Treponema sp.]|nr:helix-turn-helix transcriptional regulator [Treponema sp.]
MEFWNKIKDELDFKGISQKEFAAKLDINIQTFRNSISLNRLPDLVTAYKMAQELDQPLEYFINDDPVPPNNYHLPTREIELLSNYRKLSDKEKKTIDLATQILASDYKEPNSDIF